MTVFLLFRLYKNWAIKTGIPYHKLGRKVLYKWADVQTYLDNARVETTQNLDF